MKQNLSPRSRSSEVDALARPSRRRGHNRKQAALAAEMESLQEGFINDPYYCDECCSSVCEHTRRTLSRAKQGCCPWCSDAEPGTCDVHRWEWWHASPATSARRRAASLTKELDHAAGEGDWKRVRSIAQAIKMIVEPIAGWPGHALPPSLAAREDDGEEIDTTSIRHASKTLRIASDVLASNDAGKHEGAHEILWAMGELIASISAGCY